MPAKLLAPTGSKALDQFIADWSLNISREHPMYGNMYTSRVNGLRVTVYRTRAGRGTIKEVVVSGWGGCGTLRPTAGTAKFNVAVSKDDWIPKLHKLAADMKAEL